MQITWNGEEKSVVFHGIQFDKGKPVDVDMNSHEYNAEELVYRAKSNPYFDVTETTRLDSAKEAPKTGFAAIDKKAEDKKVS